MRGGGGGGSGSSGGEGDGGGGDLVGSTVGVNLINISAGGGGVIAGVGLRGQRHCYVLHILFLYLYRCLVYYVIVLFSYFLLYCYFY